jgi:asparagine synthase (glutamine-hydrolysing)
VCGIAGVLHLDGRPAQVGDVQDITRALAHRGPDGEGLFTDGPLALGHRRLAILDLTDSGHQPMACVEGRYRVTFNGEIYNFLELRRELEAAGHRFHTETDTEVVGHAFHRWGPDCVLRFNGMWAFAIWDTHERALFLSRDRFGVKPLFFLAQRDRFAFASELKAFLHLPDFTARRNEQAMKMMLFAFADFERVEETLIEDVSRLQAGHNLLVGPHGLKVWRWWRTLDHVPEVPATLQEQAEQFSELFSDACRLRLRSDVPVATCLSGGLDSSSVLCTLAALRRDTQATDAHERHTADSQRAFVATFPGTPQDERPYAELAIERSGADPRYRPMDQDIVAETLHRYTYDFENIGGSLMLPLWRIYRELRRDGVAVSLDGHGGDELLAGYKHYVNHELYRVSALRSPLRAVDLARTLPPMNVGDGPSATRLLLRRLRRDPALERRRRRRPSPAGGHRWMNAPMADYDLAYGAGEADEASARLGGLNGELYDAVHFQHLPHILRNFERSSMAHGVEVRMPFMDWRIVCFAFGVPATSKVGGGYAKRLLREAMRGVLPEPIRRRRDKIGFSPPMIDWFNNGLGDWALERANTPGFLESSVWNGPAIRTFVDQRQRDRSWAGADCEHVWPFLQASLWEQVFFEDRPALAPDDATPTHVEAIEDSAELGGGVL